MAVVYIDKKGCLLKRYGNTIALYKNGKKEGFVPLNPVDRVVVIGNCTVDTSLLRYLTTKGATVIFLSGRIERFPSILTARTNYNGLLRVIQYQRSLDEEFALDFSRALVERKTSEQICLLRQLGNCGRNSGIHIKGIIEQMESLVVTMKQTSSIDTLRGLEGTATRLYFSGLVRFFPPELGFRNRTRRPPKDPVNAMLSFNYTLFYAEIITALFVVGLDPTIGFYHKFDYGRDSLACDIEEVFRPKIDRFVCELFMNRGFSEKDFVKHSGGVFLKKEARARFYPLYEDWVSPLRAELREFIRILTEEIKNGQKPLSFSRPSLED